MGKPKLGKPQKSKKQKKLKSVDPFCKGSRTKSREVGLNLKPKSYIQEVPRKLQNLGLLIKDTRKGLTGKKSRNKFQHKPDGPKYKNDYTTPLGEENENPQSIKNKNSGTKTKNASINSEPNQKFTKKWKPSQKEFESYVDNLKPTRELVEPFEFKKVKGESNNAFLKRIEKETNHVLMKSKIDDQFDTNDLHKMKVIAKKKSKGTSNKKKERLKERKKKKTDAAKEKKMDKLFDFSQLQDKVEFGDVAHAPPTLTVLPKKANLDHQNKPGLRMPELKEAIKKNLEEHKHLSVLHQREVGKSVKRKDLSEVEKRASDSQRENFIDLYRSMKKRKIK